MILLVANLDVQETFWNSFTPGLYQIATWVIVAILGGIVGAFIQDKMKGWNRDKKLLRFNRSNIRIIYPSVANAEFHAKILIEVFNPADEQRHLDSVNLRATPTGNFDLRSAWHEQNKLLTILNDRWVTDIRIPPRSHYTFYFDVGLVKARRTNLSTGKSEIDLELLEKQRSRFALLADAKHLQFSARYTHNNKTINRNLKIENENKDTYTKILQTAEKLFESNKSKK